MTTENPKPAPRQRHPLLTRSEIISKEHQRRELVRLQISHNLTCEQLTGLHELDHELQPYDIVGVMFEELAANRSAVEELKREVKMAVDSKIDQIRIHKLNTEQWRAERDLLRAEVERLADELKRANHFADMARDQVKYARLERDDAYNRYQKLVEYVADAEVIKAPAPIAVSVSTDKSVDIDNLRTEAQALAEALRFYDDPPYASIASRALDRWEKFEGEG